MTGARSPLAGLRVLVTASEPEALCALLAARGAEPVAVATIAIRSVDPAPLERALASAWDWIVVTSANGARAVQGRAAGAHGGARWAAVGPRTAAVLRAGGIEPAAVPAEGTGIAVARAMGAVEGRRVLLARARAAGSELPAALRRGGALVEEVAAYETEEGPESARAPLAAALDHGIDAAVFTSGSTVRGFARLAGEPARALAGAVVVAIGPTTAAAARGLGLEPRVAGGRTPVDIVAALEDGASLRAPAARG